MKGTVLLIDGDIFAYKASFGCERAVDLGDDIVNLSADLKQAESNVEDFIDGVMDKLGTTECIVALSGDTNFRKSIFPDYKGNRKNIRKPLALRHVKQHIAKKYNTKTKPNIEADDVLGILCTHPTLVPGKKVIVSTDKDLLQIPGRHYNPDKDVKRMVSEQQGDLQFFTQVLTGDVVDNFPGCKGIGPKTAEKILDVMADEGPARRQAWWHRIVQAYAKAGFTEADALVQARVARILRHTDYDFNKKEPILWTP